MTERRKIDRPASSFDRLENLGGTLYCRRPPPALGPDQETKTMGHRGTPDRQLIMQFLNGVGDGQIWYDTNALEWRAQVKGVKSHTVTVRIGAWGRTAQKISADLLGRKMPKLTASSRIYLNGHGDWQSQTLGGATVYDVANLLGPFNLPNGILISILGCELARDMSSTGYGLIGHSVDCFASNLHLLLGEDKGLEAIVFARVQEAGVALKGKQRGRKTIWLGPEESGLPCEFKLEKSKVCYWWDGGQQRRGWANYVTNQIDVIDDD
jgi:hypothetical protein